MGIFRFGVGFAEDMICGPMQQTNKLVEQSFGRVLEESTCPPSTFDTQRTHCCPGRGLVGHLHRLIGLCMFSQKKVSCRASKGSQESWS